MTDFIGFVCSASCCECGCSQLIVVTMLLPACIYIHIEPRSTSNVLAVTEGSWLNAGNKSVSFADAGETVVYQYKVSTGWCRDSTLIEHPNELHG